MCTTHIKRLYLSLSLSLSRLAEMDIKKICVPYKPCYCAAAMPVVHGCNLMHTTKCMNLSISSLVVALHWLYVELCVCVCSAFVIDMLSVSCVCVLDCLWFGGLWWLCALWRNAISFRPGSFPLPFQLCISILCARCSASFYGFFFISFCNKLYAHPSAQEISWPLIFLYSCRKTNWKKLIYE